MFLVLPRYRLRISVFAIPFALVMLWCEGGLPFALLLLSALLHEIGHLAALSYFGHRPRRIDLLPMGALIVVPEGITDSEEWKIALAGPVTSLFVAFVAGVFFVLVPSLPLLFAFVINLVIALFNLLPIKQLDGGKALFCFLTAWQSRVGFISEKKQKRTERVCSALSYASVMLFVFVSVLCVSATELNLGVVLMSSVLIIQLISKC